MYLAYLDPGSGSMLAAAVVAGFAGAMVAVKMWWRRLTSKFRRQQPEQVATEPVATQAESGSESPEAASPVSPVETAGRSDRES